MQNTDKNKTVPISCRVPTSFKEKLDQKAHKGYRDVSKEMLMLLEAGYKAVYNENAELQKVA